MSAAATPALPSSSSPTLTLVNPTSDEQTRTWSYSYPAWGHGLTLQGYLGREAYLLTIPLARDGGITNWILTDSAAPDGGSGRPVLASCETLRKRAVVRAKDGAVRDVWAHGIASVFTHADFRGRGYAGRMIALLRERLAKQKRETGEPAFSVLFSDIGKQFYATSGWLPFESAHVEFSVRAAAQSASPSAQPIHDEDLPALAELDESLLRRQLSFPGSRDIRVALLPNLDALQWHFFRESFICNSAFGRKPAVRGAIYTPPSSPPRSRVWGLWVRTHYGGVEQPQKNVLNFIRFVVEDEGISDEELSKAIMAILSVAQKEAKEWSITKIDMWNPSNRVKKLMEKAKELESTFVDRKEQNLASLNWFGEGSTDQVEWIANERFGWC